MSRSFDMPARRQAAGFDFDVVSDAPAKPKPTPRPDIREATPPEQAVMQRNEPEP
jgi:hypothetical protein